LVKTKNVKNLSRILKIRYFKARDGGTRDLRKDIDSCPNTEGLVVAVFMNSGITKFSDSNQNSYSMATNLKG